MADLSSLPSELMLHVLSYLPIRDLLCFSVTSRSSYALASSSLQTLSLGIYPTRVSSLISQLSSTNPSASPYSRSRRSSLEHGRKAASTPAKPETTAADLFNENCTVAHVIPSASNFQPHTLLAFHTALTSSILARYRVSLRHLELSVWALTPPVAKALAQLHNLRCLSLRVEDPFGRGFLRRWVINWGHDGDGKAGTGVEWNELALAWKRLQVLRVSGADVSDWQLCQIVKNNAGLKELWLNKCPAVGRELLTFLGGEWEGRAGLETLGLVDCNLDADVNDEVVRHVGGLSNLKLLSLLDCRGLSNEAVERMNEDVWHIPDVELPHSTDNGLAPAVIEVDPAYIDIDDDD
ncbi:uncharacterized protein K452DRAFT_227808 [Aplosporella prunicola CBS 121167]|uniref:F-box domain-containing protein n=1 Tax=Aplosporella prunicola CBS 121167 TaxID=1176127 RepID=A0A6A6BC10_9PEZI|nr:uncharacterized protein K452DRAFT_227808 [Aplosporella prunicola CBS 121167]KAF2141660.1 hypothetical protein K452DRAFT_227808 [Aplosporella prunicola CBS 121167]